MPRYVMGSEIVVFTNSLGLLVPERGVEPDFDASQDTIENIINVQLRDVLKQYSSQLK
jgi:DNA mismatch repair protein MSH6